MNPVLYGALRSGVQYAISWLFAHFAILSQFADAPAAVDWVMGAVVFAGYVYLVNWLATRPGDNYWSQLARLVAKVLMLGLTKTPAYPARD